MSQTFIENLPKVELHAHINGSISEATMGKLVAGREDQFKNWRLTFNKGETGTLEDCFKIFKLIHQISDSTKAAYTITYDVIHEFAEDNVKYLELRSTPRAVESTKMTKASYVESVLRAIEDCSKEDIDINVKLLLAIDRRNDITVAKETVDLAERYSRLSNGRVVGIDLSGDPSVGDAREFLPVLKDAKNRGLKLALHLAEVPAVDETLDILQILPDRIGHGTCLHPEAGGSQELVEFVTKHRIPLELCLTSNIKGQTVPNLDNHQFKFWYDRGHPCIICTDDKGVFATSLSEEYSLAAETFDLSQSTLWDISYSSIDCTFTNSGEKQLLRKKWYQNKSSSIS